MNVLPQKYQERIEARKRGTGPAQKTLRGFTIIPPPKTQPSLQSSFKKSSNANVTLLHKNSPSTSAQPSQQYLSSTISSHEDKITPKTTRSAAREAGYTPTFQIKWGSNSTSVIMSARPTPSSSSSSPAPSQTSTPVLNVLQPIIAKSQSIIPPREKSARKRVIVEEDTEDDEKDSSWYRKRNKNADGIAQPIETKKSNDSAASTKEPAIVQSEINKHDESTMIEDLNEEDEDENHLDKEDENHLDEDENHLDEEDENHLDEEDEDEDENEINADENEERQYSTNKIHLQNSTISNLKSQASSSSKTTGEQLQKRAKRPRTTFKVNKIISNGKQKQKVSINEVDVIDEAISGVIADALETNTHSSLKERIRLFGKEVETRFIEQADVYDEHFLLQSAVTKAKGRKKSIRQQLLLAHRKREDITTKLAAVQNELDTVDTEYRKMEQMHVFLTQLDTLRKAACDNEKVDRNTKSLRYTAKLGTANLAATIAARCGSISSGGGALAAVRRLNSLLESCEVVIRNEMVRQ